MTGVADVVVIGAGAAGIAAGRALRAAGLDVVVLEARDRIGGRCHTDTTSLGVPWDRGAHWLHDAERNPMRAHAERLGVRYSRGPRRFLVRRSQGFAEPDWVEQLEAWIDRAFAAVAAAGERGEDRPASEVVPAHPRFRPHFRAMFDSRFAAFNGVEPERMSTLDYARSIDGANWPVLDGYGALLAALATELPVELRTPVEAVRFGGRSVGIETARGTLEAAAAVITVPTAVLAAADIAFDPALPAAHRDAFDALPLGEANKVAFAFERNVFGREDHHFLAFEHDTLAATRFDVRPAGRNLAIAYFGGRFAREIEAAGEAAMREFALSRLRSAYGADLVREVRSVACTGWCGDVHARGGYSCARPGRADARRTLSEPVAERLVFAGEAASITAYGTVHGAWQSGEAAAGRVVGMLRAQGARPASLHQAGSPLM
ncbi:MAG TPA: NAD(P)/FAD-dependent oxidoreductase [Geminicoccaceae bacterium]